jgi:hypothetical protein
LSVLELGLGLELGLELGLYTYRGKRIPSVIRLEILEMLVIRLTLTLFKVTI